MSDAVLGRKRSKYVQVLLVETHRDLLRARGADSDVEIFKMCCELLHTVTCPERALLIVTAEIRDLRLSFGAVPISDLPWSLAIVDSSVFRRNQPCER